jgi:catechol 2,3-dioxygenase-like lactoylglutathione lyase family enzyme
MTARVGFVARTAEEKAYREGDDIVRPIPFVYTTDMERSIGWYRSVIPGARLVDSSPHWSELEIDGWILAFHGAEQVTSGGAAGITFVASERLEDLVSRLAQLGIEPLRGIQTEPFGRSLVLEDPEGFRFQVNEYAG